MNYDDLLREQTKLGFERFIDFIREDKNLLYDIAERTDNLEFYKNNVYNGKTLISYKITITSANIKSPIAEVLISDVITDNNTFLGWTKKVSKDPSVIVSLKL